MRFCVFTTKISSYSETSLHSELFLSLSLSLSPLVFVSLRGIAVALLRRKKENSKVSRNVLANYRIALARAYSRSSARRRGYLSRDFRVCKGRKRGRKKRSFPSSLYFPWGKREREEGETIERRSLLTILEFIPLARGFSSVGRRMSGIGDMIHLFLYPVAFGNSLDRLPNPSAPHSPRRPIEPNRLGVLSRSIVYAHGRLLASN